MNVYILYMYRLISISRVYSTTATVPLQEIWAIVQWFSWAQVLTVKTPNFRSMMFWSPVFNPTKHFENGATRKLARVCYRILFQFTNRSWITTWRLFCQFFAKFRAFRKKIAQSFYVFSSGKLD